MEDYLKFCASRGEAVVASDKCGDRLDEERDPLKGEKKKELRFAPDDQVGEWEEEIERWLPEAVGYSVYDARLTDGSDLTDFMDMEPTGRRDERGREIWWVTPKSWERARAALALYGVEIGPCEGSLRSDTNLVSLAKRTLGRLRRADPGT